MIGGQVADLEGEGKPPEPRCSRPSTAPRPGPAARQPAARRHLRGGRREPVRRALPLWRTRRPGVPDCGRYPRRGRILRSARKNRRQGRATGQDHLPRGLWPGNLAPHGRRGVRARPPGAGTVRRAAWRACTRSPTTLSVASHEWAFVEVAESADSHSIAVQASIRSTITRTAAGLPSLFMPLATLSPARR
jgi:hypothetical protein